jgi:hypothetical protein
VHAQSEKIIKVQSVDFFSTCLLCRNCVEEIVDHSATNAVASGICQGFQHGFGVQFDNLDSGGKFAANFGGILRPAAKSKAATCESGEDFRKRMQPCYSAF